MTALEQATALSVTIYLLTRKQHEQRGLPKLQSMMP
jgi:hypothetical protein